MKTLFRVLCVLLAGTFPPHPSQAQQGQMPVCPGQNRHVDDQRLEYLTTTFIEELRDDTDRTGIVALTGHASWSARLRPVLQPRFARTQSICRDMPGLCQPRSQDLCAAVPQACERPQPTGAAVSFEDAVEAARATARAAIAQSTPLGTRAALLTQVKATQQLGGFSNTLRQQIAEYVVAKELLARGEELLIEFRGSLIHESCAASFIVVHPQLVGVSPTATTMGTTLRDVDIGLGGFGLPGPATNVNLLGTMTDRANFFAGFLTHVGAAQGVATDMLRITGSIRDQLVGSDMQIENHNAGLPPAAGNHFTAEWLLSPLFTHHYYAMTARRELDFDRNAIDDGIAQLRAGLTQFPPGGGAGSSTFLPALVESYCGSSGGLAADLPAVLDDQGRIAPFLQAQAAAGMPRGDAQLIVEATVICAMRWAHQASNELRANSFILDASFAQERTPSSVLLQRMRDRRDAYTARAQRVSARATEIDQIVP